MEIKDVYSDYNYLPEVQTVDADFETVVFPVQVVHCLEVYI